MRNEMTYQQARRIRNKDYSLKNLITRNIRSSDMSVGQSIKSALKEKFDIKTRLGARVKGIKEKFDPLNIVKFLTFGSNIGPALYGRLVGRSKADIRNFTGGRQTYDDYTPTATKIGRDPRAGGDTTGMTAVLNDMLTFLHKSHENDMILREKENNLREGEKHDDEKRHKKLLKALEKVGFSGTASKVKSEGPGLFDGIFDSIKSFVQGMVDKAMMAFEWIKDLRFLTKISNLGKLAGIIGWFASPVGLAVLAATSLAALAYLLYKAKQEGPTPEDAAEILRTTPPQAMTKERREELEKIVSKGGEKAQEVLKSGDASAIAAAGGTDKLNQQVANATNKESLKPNLSVSPRPIPNGKNDLQIQSWNSKYGQTHNPDGKPKTVSADTSVDDAEMKKLQRQNNMTPAPVSVPPTSAAVSTSTNENQNLNLQAVNKPATSTVTNKNVVNNVQRPQVKISMPAVRNLEQTFQRVIYNSTRVV